MKFWKKKVLEHETSRQSWEGVSQVVEDSVGRGWVRLCWAVLGGRGGLSKERKWWVGWGGLPAGAEG